MNYLGTIFLLMLSTVFAGSESSVEIQANEAKSALRNVEESMTQAEGLDADMMELLGEGPELSERTVEVESTTTVVTPEDVAHTREVQAQREEAEEYVAERVEKESDNYRDSEGATHLMQIEGMPAVPALVGRPVSGTPAGGVGPAVSTPGPIHPRLRNSVKPKLKGMAWEQLQSLAGISVQIEGTDEYISETARQGFDTKPFRNRALKRSDVREDKILKGYLPGVRHSTTKKMKFEDVLNYFEWAEDQRGLYQKQFKLLKRNLENQSYAMRSIYLPSSRTRKLADIRNDLNQAKNMLPVLLSKKKQAESDREYFRKLSKRHQQQSNDVSNMLERVYKDWNALPRDNCTQGQIDSFVRTHGASVGKSVTPQKISWNLGSIRGKSDAQWRADITAQWDLYLKYNNTSDQHHRTAGSLGYDITNKTRQIQTLESELKSTDQRLGKAEEEWRKVKDRLNTLAEDVDRYRQQYETLYNNTKELVIELRKAKNE